MAKKTVMHLQTDLGLGRRLDAFASRTRQSKEEIIEDALQGYLDMQEEFEILIKQGIEAADRGEFATEDEVSRVFNKYRPV